jgi:hypothetical protein
VTTRMFSGWGCLGEALGGIGGDGCVGADKWSCWDSRTSMVEGFEVTGEMEVEEEDVQASSRRQSVRSKIPCALPQHELIGYPALPTITDFEDCSYQIGINTIGGMGSGWRKALWDCRLVHGSEP